MNFSKTKSIIIKINNSKFLDYLYFKLLSQTKQSKSIYISKNNFSKYSNIIIHNTNVNSYDDLYIFLHSCTETLTNCIIKFYTYPLLHRIFSKHYFYFSSIEEVNILHNTVNKLNTLILELYSCIYPSIYSYLNDLFTNSNHISIYLEGFINFRLSKYNTFITNILEKQVQEYILEKEYLNLIHILQDYINSTPPNNIIVNILFTKDSISLLDNNYNKIKLSNNSSNKFISDFDLSSNDKILNTLLDLLPLKIVIHNSNIKESVYLNFINTLKLIFEDRIAICNNCNLCKMHNK